MSFLYFVLAFFFPNANTTQIVLPTLDLFVHHTLVNLASYLKIMKYFLIAVIILILKKGTRMQVHLPFLTQSKLNDAQCNIGFNKLNCLRLLIVNQEFYTYVQILIT